MRSKQQRQQKSATSQNQLLCDEIKRFIVNKWTNTLSLSPEESLSLSCNGVCAWCATLLFQKWQPAFKFIAISSTDKLGTATQRVFRWYHYALITPFHCEPRAQQHKITN